MTPPDHRPDIDGLRALAILPVLFFHTGVAGMPGGFVGVDVFFVISGYLISRMIYADLDAGRFSFVAFYERRARRIVPAFAAVSLATLIAAIILLFPTALIDFAKSLLWSALAVGNIYFWERSDYFAPEAATQPLLHYWSLGVEEQFYFLFPAFAIAAWKLPVQTRGWVLAVLATISFGAAEFVVSRAPETAFYLLPFRAWELLAGSLLALPSLRRPPATSVAAFAALTGVGMIMLAVATFSETMRFPGLSAAMPVGGAALAIWGGLTSNRASRALGIAPLTYVGRISYSLYLVHWPILVFSHIVAPGAVSWLRSLSVIALSFLLAHLSYRFVETPPRRNSAAWNRSRIATLTVGGSTLFAAAAGAVILSDGLPGRLPPAAARMLTYHYDRIGPYREDICFLTRHQNAEAIDAAKCLPAGGQVALIWGDSHAAHFVPGLTQVLEERSYKVAQLTASGCPPIAGRDMPRRPNCRGFNAFALNWIRSHRPALVIVSAIWAHDSTDYDDLASQMREIAAFGVKPVILGPGPIFPEAVPAMLARRLTGGNEDAQSRHDINVAAYDADERMRDRFASEPATYVSVLKAACPGRVCALLEGSEPVWWDAEHLTSIGSAKLATAIASRLPSPP